MIMARTQPEASPPVDTAKGKSGATARVPLGNPKYPYSLTPAALAKFLEYVPNKPKPAKVDTQLLKSWDLKNNNDITLVRVLKEVEVLGADSAPTELYEALMHGGDGKKQLASAIRDRYKELFNAEHEPYGDAAVKLFNIHGGTQSAQTLKLMRLTFIALCKAADFVGAPAKLAEGNPSSKKKERGIDELADKHSMRSSGPSVVINIQVTLPSGLDEKGYDAFFASMKKNLWPSK